jgi:hypothetical protein
MILSRRLHGNLKLKDKDVTQCFNVTQFRAGNDNSLVK